MREVQGRHFRIWNGVSLFDGGPYLEPLRVADTTSPGAASPAPSSWRSWPPAARWAVGCGTGCAFLALLNTLALWGFVSFLFHIRPPEGMVVEARVPRTVTAGRKFPLVLTVRNEGTAAFTISTVTARPQLFKQMSLENPKPPPSAPPTRALGTTAWVYQKSLAPGEKWSVTFDATALQPGKVNGSLEVQAGLAPKAARFSVEVKPR
jgi:hypothetical protein